jgi:hypothetical protein
MENSKNKLMLNAITGPKVTAPAVCPEVLQGFLDPQYGFFKTYCIESESSAWHGHLKNIGLQFKIPNTILLPPQVAEMLSLYNDDRATLGLSPLSEAHAVYYRKKVVDKSIIDELPVFRTGFELNGKQLDFNMSGTAISLLGWEPEGSFISPHTELVEIDSLSAINHNEGNIGSVVTDVPAKETNKSLNKNNNNNLLP